MPVLRRVATVALLCVTLAACGFQEADKRMAEQVDAITTVARTASGTPEEIADTVRKAPLGEYMSLKVLSSERVSEEGITRLKYELHFEGWPDGFGDVPPRTCRYTMDFDSNGLVGEPNRVSCGDA